MSLYDVLNTLYSSWLDHWLCNACPVNPSRAMEAAQQALEDYAWRYIEDGLPTEEGQYEVALVNRDGKRFRGTERFYPDHPYPSCWHRPSATYDDYWTIYAWRKADYEPLPEPKGA